jgi:hypothetical protein
MHYNRAALLHCPPRVARGASRGRRYREVTIEMLVPDSLVRDFAFSYFANTLVVRTGGLFAMTTRCFAVQGQLAWSNDSSLGRTSWRQKRIPTAVATERIISKLRLTPAITIHDVNANELCDDE